MSDFKDILDTRAHKETLGVLREMSRSKTVVLPSQMDVTVKNPQTEVEVSNFGDILRSLALLGKGIENIVEVVKAQKLEIPDKEIQEVKGYVETNVATGEIEKQLSMVIDAVQALHKEIKKLPAKTELPKISFPKIDIPTPPKIVSVDNLGAITKGLAEIKKTIGGLKFPEQQESEKLDLEPLLNAVDSVREAVRGIVIPIPPGTTASFKNINGENASVIIGSDGSIPTRPGTTTATPTITRVNDTASSTQLLASNTSRKMASFFNDSTATLYIKLGTTATTTDFWLFLRPFEYAELPAPVFTGRIDGIWSSDASGGVQVTEWS